MQQFFNTKNWRTQAKQILFRWLFIGTLISTLFSLTGFLGNFHRLLELTSHFKLQYLIVGCLALIFFSLTKRKLLSLVSLFCIVLNLVVILPWYVPQPRAANETAGEPMRILLANVLTSNRRYSEVISLIKESQPDVAVFLEINDIWSKQLKAIDKLMPFSLVYPKEDNFGIALYSKFPLKNSSTRFFIDEDVASLLADVMIKDQNISLIATHPLPPIDREYFNLRNKHLEEIGKYVQTLPNPKVAIGDLNVTMWSPYYKKFVQNTGLQNARAGFGILPTWPTQMPLLYIPLDHCLVSSDIKVVQVRSGRNIGSDHLPLITDIRIPRKNVSMFASPGF